MARRDEILDALIDIFRNKGISSDFTMSQLAAKVNIGKSTIYEYFKTKDEVVQLAITRVIEQAVDNVYSRDIDEHDSFEEMYRSELRFLFNIAVNSRFLLNVIQPSFKTLLPESCREGIVIKIRKVSRHYEQRFATIFQKGIEDGIISKENILVNSLLVSSLVSGSIMRLANFNAESHASVDVEDYIDAIYQATLKITN